MPAKRRVVRKKKGERVKVRCGSRLDVAKESATLNLHSSEADGCVELPAIGGNGCCR